MKSIKAIIAGSVFVALVLLSLQLAYLFIAVAYNELAANFPFLNSITGYFRYVIGIPVFILVMFTGGYLTASILNTHSFMKIGIHCLVVSLTTIGSTMYSALENSNITFTGIFVIVLAFVALLGGGFYWLRRNRAQLDTQGV